MFRIILELIITILVAMVARAVISSVAKGLGNAALKSPMALGTRRPEAREANSAIPLTRSSRSPADDLGPVVQSLEPGGRLSDDRPAREICQLSREHRRQRGLTGLLVCAREAAG